MLKGMHQRITFFWRLAARPRGLEGFLGLLRCCATKFEAIPGRSRAARRARLLAMRSSRARSYGFMPGHQAAKFWLGATFRVHDPEHDMYGIARSHQKAEDFQKRACQT
jgi:hypothetical protein